MAAPTIYSGLVGYYTFDTLLAGKVPDASNHFAEGVLTSAALVSGLLGNGLRTSSSTGKMVILDIPEQRRSETQRVCVNIWINLDSALNAMWGTPVFIDKTGGLTKGYFLGVLPGGGNVISFRIYNAAGTPYTASYTESATSGWVMVTGVYEGSVVRIYRNAVSQNTAAADGSLSFADVDSNNIGLGFQGILDELSIWTVQLTSGNVTTLYNSGSGYSLVLPEMYSGQENAAFSQFLSAPGQSVAIPETDYLPPLDLYAIAAQVVIAGSLQTPSMAYTSSPYAVVDSPSRVFINPYPTIVSITVDSNRNVLGVGNAGPTDANTVSTWWQIDLSDGRIFVLAERRNGMHYPTNHDQTDAWFVPSGQNWRGLYATFWIQAADDASQTWHSPPVQLLGPLWDNSGDGYVVPPLPPRFPLGLPQIPSGETPGPGVYRPRIRDNSGRR